MPFLSLLCIERGWTPDAFSAAGIIAADSQQVVFALPEHIRDIHLKRFVPVPRIILPPDFSAVQENDSRIVDGPDAEEYFFPCGKLRRPESDAIVKIPSGLIGVTLSARRIPGGDFLKIL